MTRASVRSNSQSEVIDLLATDLRRPNHSATNHLANRSSVPDSAYGLVARREDREWSDDRTTMGDS